MLVHRLAAATDRLVLAEVVCADDHRRWSAVEQVTAPGLVLVRRGAFLRTADGTAAVLDPGAGYLQRPGDEERFAHPHTPGDTTTVLRPAADLWAELAAPTATVTVTPAAALTHWTMLRAARRGDVAVALDHAVTLLRAVVAAEPARSGAGPVGAARRRRLVDEARQLLAGDPAIPLPALADRLGVSPWHLSRSFPRVTGEALTAHRQRLRVHRALELLATTDLPLAGIAAECGYADQPHLTRSLRAATGRTPGRLADLTRS